MRSEELPNDATSIVGEGLAPPESFPIISLYHAEHINLSVGYGACDVPKPFLSMTPKRGANACFRRDDHWSSENDGCFIDRKRRIGYKRSCHAVRRQAPYPTKRTSPQLTCFMIQRPAAGRRTRVSAPYTTKRTSPQPTLFINQRPAAGAPRRSPTISLQRLL